MFAAASGAALLVAGIAGFFYTSAFGSPGHSAAIFGVFDANGWQNVLHVASGALGLLALGAYERRYALGASALYLALAAWGFAAGDRHALAGFLARGKWTDVLHLVLGLAGLAAVTAGLRRDRA